MRIRIKQSIWDCRAGIYSGLARKKSTFFVGVLWVRLSAENESASFYRSGSNLEGLHTNASHIDSSLYSLLLVEEVWLAGARKAAGTQTDAMASKRQSPTGASITCPLLQTTAQEARSSPCSESTPKTLHLQSMAYRKSISITQRYSIDACQPLSYFEYSREQLKNMHFCASKKAKLIQFRTAEGTFH